jgi:hypothetical protein
MDKTIDTISGLEKSGRSIYQNNKSYRDIATVMEHPEFRQFFDLYLSDINNAKTMLLFMKLYEYVENNSTSLSPYEKIAMVKGIIDNGELRKKICNASMIFSGKMNRSCILPSIAPKSA